MGTRRVFYGFFSVLNMNTMEVDKRGKVVCVQRTSFCQVTKWASYMNNNKKIFSIFVLKYISVAVPFTLT